jgi:hypothetical protein
MIEGGKPGFDADFPFSKIAPLTSDNVHEERTIHRLARKKWDYSTGQKQ